jgi:exopolysaccharide biosynthesis WecB/TagA/CpsF family protein
MAVTALAVHGVMTGVLDATQRYRLNHIDMVVPDGQPVRWALNRLYNAQLPDRVYGPTLTLKLCELAARESLPIYLYGSRPAVLQALSRNLRARFPGLILAGTQASRFRKISPEEKQAIVETIRSSGAAMLFVGLGCPRQEVWVFEYRNALALPLIAVGAAFDFHAGLLPQAPVRMQRLGLEWLYRLTREPKRLWRRYILLNPAYLVLLALQASGLKRFDIGSATAPNHEIGYG